MLIARAGLLLAVLELQSNYAENAEVLDNIYLNAESAKDHKKNKHEKTMRSI